MPSRKTNRFSPPKWVLNGFHISREKYASLIARQRGRCAVCGKTNLPDARRSLSPAENADRLYGLFCDRCLSAAACLRYDVDLGSNLVEVLAAGGERLEQGTPAEVKPAPPKKPATAAMRLEDSPDDDEPHDPALADEELSVEELRDLLDVDDQNVPPFA